MSSVARKSGRKLGTYRDARIAHAIHYKAVAGYTLARRRYEKLYREWEEAYYNGTADELVRPTAPEGMRWVMPEGWKRLGSGCYRTAYLSPRGVVYKVNARRYDGEEYDGYNHAEFRNIITIKSTRTVPEMWRIPDATLYRMPEMQHTDDYRGRKFRGNDYVIAMPLIDTEVPLNTCYSWDDEPCKCADEPGNIRVGGVCTRKLFREASKALHLSDLHTNNVFPQADGTLVVVDVAI